MFSYDVLLPLNVFHKGTPESPIPFQRNENVWVYLAKHIMNVSEFSLKGGTYVEQTFISCLVGVGTSLNQIKNHTIFWFINKPISYSDIYNWGPITTEKDMSMFSLQVRTVTPAGQCVIFTGCPNQWFNLSVSNSLKCNTTISVSYANAHVKLLAGWFLLCGKIAYSYVPAYSTGGPCSLGRLTVFLPQNLIRPDIAESLPWIPPVTAIYIYSTQLNMFPCLFL